MPRPHSSDQRARARDSVIRSETFPDSDLTLQRERLDETWPASPRSLHPTPDPTRGCLLGRRYRLSHVIASGAFGTVFAARDEHLQKAVAVKILTGRAAISIEHRARFQREAVVASGLCHDGIVRVTDVDRERDGTSYLVMELLEGTTLEPLIERGPLDLRSALALAAGTLERHPPPPRRSSARPTHAREAREMPAALAMVETSTKAKGWRSRARRRCTAAERRNRGGG